MSEAVGPGTAVDPAITRQGLEVIVDPNNNLYTAEQKATAQHFLDQLERDSTTVLDQGVEATLQAQRARAAANLNRATPGGPLASAAQQSLDHIDELIAANRGPSWRQSQVHRSTGNRSIDRSVGFDKSTRLDVKRAQTEGMRDAADQAGYPPEEFNAVNVEYGGLKSDEKQLNKIARKDEPGAYNDIFGGQGEQKKALWANLERNADPTELAQILSQNLELRGRGPAAAGRPELPPNTGLNTAVVEWWEKMPETMRSRYAPQGTQTRARIDANVALIKADARRGGASQVEEYPGISLAGASLMMGQPLAAGAQLVPKTANILVGRYLRDPEFARDVITGQRPNMTPLDLARIMSSAVAGSQ